MKLSKERQEEFLQKRHLVLMDEVDGEHQEYITNSIIYLNMKDESSVITLIIDSAGGGAIHGYWIADAIENSKAPIRGVVVGAAYSAAMVVLQSCHIRSAYRHAKFMIHGIGFRTASIGSVAFESEFAFYRKLTERFLEEVGIRSGRPERIRELCANEIFFFAPEALELNLINEIVVPDKDKPA